MQSLQYGEQSFALPVEATGDVGNDLGVGVEFPHLSDLPTEVPTLLAGTDPAVADHPRGNRTPLVNPAKAGIQEVFATASV